MEKSFKIPWFQSPPTSCWWPQQRCTACYPWENPLYISMVISHSVLFIRLPFRVNLWTWKNQVKWSAIPGFIGESGTSWQSHSKICPLIYIIIHPMSRLEHIWLRYNCYSLTSLNSSYHVASTKSPSPTSWVLSCLSQHHPTSWKVRNKTAPWPRPSRIFFCGSSSQRSSDFFRIVECVEHYKIMEFITNQPVIELYLVIYQNIPIIYISHVVG